MSDSPRVILRIDIMTDYGRRIHTGITRYLRASPPWLIDLDLGEFDAPVPSWLKRWRGDGVICRALTPAFLRWLAKANIPVVNLNDAEKNGHGLPWIRSDDHAIGRLAAEHLLERGFRQFAFCGFVAQGWSVRRREGFTAALSGRAKFCGAYEVAWRSHPYSYLWEPEKGAICRWLAELHRPLALLACSDLLGQQVLDACRRIGLAVPEEMAVLGVDDDALLCELCQPALSSVRPDAERIGYEAAALLDRLMAGDPPPPAEQLVSPLDIITRRSTDVLAIDDPFIAAAARYIRENACRGATIREVLRQVPISRTVLEQKFRRYLGHSPKSEIQKVQLKRVQQLLAGTDLPLDRIAGLAGYKHPEYMSVAFKRLMGQTPGQYRSQVQSTRGSPRMEPDANS
jgi:LacI family transcriptional regulator